MSVESRAPVGNDITLRAIKKLGRIGRQYFSYQKFSA